MITLQKAPNGEFVNKTAALILFYFIYFIFNKSCLIDQCVLVKLCRAFGLPIEKSIETLIFYLTFQWDLGHMCLLFLLDLWFGNQLWLWPIEYHFQSIFFFILLVARWLLSKLPIGLQVTWLQLQLFLLQVTFSVVWLWLQLQNLKTIISAIYAFVVIIVVRKKFILQTVIILLRLRYFSYFLEINN